ncbi:DUF4351 domain-containing protein, partial [Anabaena aphanizomenioides LEGE 00250]
LGLLGDLAKTPAIFEPYRNSVTDEQIEDCILKLLEVKRVLRKEFKDKNTKIPDHQIPRLWIITPTLSDRILSSFGAIPSTKFCQGVYEIAEYFRAGIVVIHQLPETPETIWLRILGREKVQSKAIDELLSLDTDEQFKRKTLELFYVLMDRIAIRNPKTITEVNMKRLVNYYQQDRDLAVQEGKTEGQLSLVIRLLTKKFQEINPNITQKIQQLSLEKIEELAEALLDFNQYQDLENWLQQNQ